MFPRSVDRRELIVQSLGMSHADCDVLGPRSGFILRVCAPVSYSSLVYDLGARQIHREVMMTQMFRLGQCATEDGGSIFVSVLVFYEEAFAEQLGAVSLKSTSPEVPNLGGASLRHVPTKPWRCELTPMHLALGHFVFFCSAVAVSDCGYQIVGFKQSNNMRMVELHDY